MPKSTVDLILQTPDNNSLYVTKIDKSHPTQQDFIAVLFDANISVLDINLNQPLDITKPHVMLPITVNSTLSINELQSGLKKLTAALKWITLLAKNNKTVKLFIPIVDVNNWSLLEVNITEGGLSSFYAPTIVTTFWEPFSSGKGISKANWTLVLKINEVLREQKFNILSTTFDPRNDITNQYYSMDYCAQEVLKESNVNHLIKEEKDPENLRKEIVQAIKRAHIRIEETQEREVNKQQKIQQVFRQWVINAIKKEGVSIKFSETLAKEKLLKEVEVYIAEELKNFIQQISTDQDLHENLLVLLKGLLQKDNLHPDIQWTISKINEKSKNVEKIFFVVLAKACIEGLKNINSLLDTEIQKAGKTEWTKEIYKVVNEILARLKIDSYLLDSKEIDILLNNKDFQEWIKTQSIQISNLKERNEEIKRNINENTVSDNTYKMIEVIFDKIIKYFEVKKITNKNITVVDEFRAWFLRSTKDINFSVLDKKYEKLLVQASDILISLAASSKNLLPYNLRVLLQSDYNDFVVELKKEHNNYIILKKEYSNTSFEEYISDISKLKISSMATQEFMEKLDSYAKELFFSSETGELDSSIQKVLTGNKIKNKKSFFKTIVKDEKLDSFEITFKQKIFIPMMLSVIEKTQESLLVLSLINKTKQHQYLFEQIISAQTRFNKLINHVNSIEFKEKLNEYQESLKLQDKFASQLISYYFMSRINVRLDELKNKNTDDAFKKITEYEDHVARVIDDKTEFHILYQFCLKEVKNFWAKINTPLEQIWNNLKQYKENDTFEKLSTESKYRNLDKKIRKFIVFNNEEQSTYQGFVIYVEDKIKQYQDRDYQNKIFYSVKEKEEVTEIVKNVQEIVENFKKIHAETRKKDQPIAELISQLIELHYKNKSEKFGDLISVFLSDSSEETVSKFNNKFLDLHIEYTDLLSTDITNGYIASIEEIKRIFSNSFRDTQTEMSEANLTLTNYTDEEFVTDDEEIEEKSNSPQKKLSENGSSFSKTLSFIDRKSSVSSFLRSPERKNSILPKIAEVTTDKLDAALFQGRNKKLPPDLVTAFGGEKNLEELFKIFGSEGVQNLIRQCSRLLLLEIVYHDLIKEIKLDAIDYNDQMQSILDAHNISLNEKLLYPAARQLILLKEILIKVNSTDTELNEKIVTWLKEINSRLEQAQKNSLTFVVKIEEIYTFIYKLMENKTLSANKCIQEWIVNADSIIVEPLMRKTRSEINNIEKQISNSIESFQNDEQIPEFKNCEVYAYLNSQIKQLVNYKETIFNHIVEIIKDIRKNRQERKSNYKIKYYLEKILLNLQELASKYNEYVNLFATCNSFEEKSIEKQQEVWLRICKEDSLLSKQLVKIHSLRNLLILDHEFKNNGDKLAEEIFKSWDENSKALLDDIYMWYETDLLDEKLFIELENKIETFIKQDKQARNLIALVFQLNDFARQWDQLKDEEKEEKLIEIENARNFLAEVNILTGNEDYKKSVDVAVSICDFSKGLDGYNKIKGFLLNWTKSNQAIPEAEIKTYLEIKTKLLNQKNLDDQPKRLIIRCDMFLLIKKIETVNSLASPKLDLLCKKIGLKHGVVNKLNSFCIMSRELQTTIVSQYKGRYATTNETLEKWIKMVADYEKGIELYSNHVQLEHYQYLKIFYDKVFNLLEKIENLNTLDKEKKFAYLLDGPKQTSLRIIDETKVVLDKFLVNTIEISKKKIEKLNTSCKLLLSQCTSSNEMYKFQKKASFGFSGVLIDTNELKTHVRLPSVFTMVDVIPALKEFTKCNTSKKEISEYLLSFNSKTALEDMQKCLQGIHNLHDALSEVELIIKKLSILDKSFKSFCIFEKAIQTQLKNRLMIDDIVSVGTPIDKIHATLNDALRAVVNNLPSNSKDKYNIVALKEKFLLIKDNYVQNKTDPHALVTFQHECMQICDAAKQILKHNGLDYYQLGLFATPLTKDLELVKQTLLELRLNKDEILKSTINEDKSVERNHKK